MLHYKHTHLECKTSDNCFPNGKENIEENEYISASDIVFFFLPHGLESIQFNNVYL